MSVISKAQLKNDFLDGKIITEPKMDDLIDSCYNESAFITKELSNADISTLNTVPVILIDPPGVGKFIQVNSCIVELTYGGGTITGQDTLSLYTISASTFLSGGNERMGRIPGFLGYGGDHRGYANIEGDGFVRGNSPLIVTAGEAGDPNPTMNASTSTVKFYINYSIITI